MSTGYLDTLNTVQRQAVTTIDGPVMVIAGPGSGKTRVLTYRIAHLINSGVSPYEILALTFTNKAAREMKERIEKVVGGATSNLWAGTFHSIFARVLRYESEHIGYPSNFTIYDTDDSKSLIRSIVKEMSLRKEDYPAGNVLGRISNCKSQLITPKAYVRNTKLIQADQIQNRPHFNEIYTAYVARCKKASAMDFDDLLYRLYELFQTNQEVLQKYRDRFKYVLVDEFQDTNFLQYAIIRKLVKFPDSPQNICIVGDDAQSIYAFRGATIDNILDFEKDFKDTQVFKLEQNYRSTPHIVQAANQLITNNARQIQKKIWTQHESGYKIRLLKCASDHEEGRRVADLILEHKNRHHVENKEIAILYRTNAQSRNFEEQLRKYNIPYRIYGGQSFYQRKEIKDMLAYYRLAINPNDEEAFKRVINYPKRGIGPTSVDKILEQARQPEWSISKALSAVDLKGKAKSQAKAFSQLMELNAQRAANMSAYDAATKIAQSSGIIKLYKDENTLESQGKIENIQSLLDGIKDFSERDELEENEETITAENRTLAAYVQNIALLTDQDNEEESQNKVVLMSVHSAKGLEFDAVFVVGMEEKLFPSFMSLENPKDIDEERRLFYVAITRARKHLTFAFANSRYRFGKLTYNNVSRFLSEVPSEHYENSHVLKMPTRDFEQSSAPSRASVKGNFAKPKSRTLRKVTLPENYTVAPAHEIKEHMQVFHPKFGVGTVKSIDGAADNKIATIVFQDEEQSERRIVLRFAKLHIL